MTVFLTRVQATLVLALSPLATSGPAAGRPSLTQFVLGVLRVAQFAQAHCGATRAGWIEWLSEGAAIRARCGGRLANGKLADASPLTLVERAQLAPVETAAEMRDAWAIPKNRIGAAEALGVGVGEWAAAIRHLPELQAELRGGGAS